MIKRARLLAVFAMACSAATVSFGQMNPVEHNDYDEPSPADLGILQNLQPANLDENGLPVGEQSIDPLAEPAPEVGSAVDVDQDNKSLAGVEKPIWSLHPFGALGVMFDDNIFISNTNRKSDVIFSAEGGLSFELGDFRNLEESYLVASYQGTGYFYTVHPQQNAYDQQADLKAQYKWTKFALQLESNYQNLNGPAREVGSFVNRNLIQNTLRGIYQYSDKLTADLEFAQNASIYEQFLSQYDYHAKLGADYLVTSRIRLGLEGVAGFLTVQDGPQQFYQQIRVRSRYEVTGKVAINFSGGLEFREYEGDTRPVRLFPVFSLGAEYTPFSGTYISLIGYCNSYGSTNFVGQNYVATGLSLSIQQRFLTRFYAGFSFGYENDTYYAVAADARANRSDNYIQAKVSIDYKFLDWLSSGVFYEFKNNASTITDLSFYDNQVGYQLAFNF